MRNQNTPAEPVKPSSTAEQGSNHANTPAVGLIVLIAGAKLVLHLLLSGRILSR